MCCFQSSEFAVDVGALRSSDGAILDPDDRLVDVVDDREQLVACLNGNESHSTAILIGTRSGFGPRGDGTSASSNSESPSPDFLNCPSRKHIEVTGEEAVSAELLHVRRGSEPALNRISPGPNSTRDPKCKDYKVTSSNRLR